MAREADQECLRRLYDVIQSNPGERAGFLARLLRWPQEKVSRGLVSLNDQGVLLAEDERGGLWLFEANAPD